MRTLNFIMSILMAYSSIILNMKTLIKTIQHTVSDDECLKVYIKELVSLCKVIYKHVQEKHPTVIEAMHNVVEIPEAVKDEIKATSDELEDEWSEILKD